MDFKITVIPNKVKNNTEEEKGVIAHSLKTYQGVLDNYEAYVDKINDAFRRQRIEKLNSLNPSGVGTTNPFMIDMRSDKYTPTLDEVKTFAYSAWAETIAKSLTPYVCGGQKKKAIRKQAYRDIKKGKYLNSEVRNIMRTFIDRISIQINEK